MKPSKLALKYRVRNIEVRLSLLIPLDHEHATPEIIVTGSSINVLRSQQLFANFTRFQETTESHLIFLRIKEYRSEPAVGQRTIRVYVVQFI